MRKYHAHRPVTPLPTQQMRSVPAPQPHELGELKEWEDGRLLHDLKEASKILTDKLGKGYSYDSLRVLILNGELQEGVHYFRKGKRIKISVHRVIFWQLS